MEQFSLSGKRALITGASSGLGASFAKVLSDAGAEVVLAARRVDRLNALADEINSSGGHASALSLDVTKPESVEAAFAQIAATGKPVDVIINNSGISREDWIASMSEDEWAAVLDTNLTGVWRVAKAAAAALMAANMPGSIVNTGSITAFRPSHLIGAYSASKAAVTNLTRTMALEWARCNIRVNALAPGYFLTEINDDFIETEAAEKMIKRIPMRRLGHIEELAGPLLLLSSDAGAYMTGATLVVDGGHLQSAL
ncbi:MAG: SDR family NAD(P)-dependent oxidoreductase [Pseudomonadota bacterium]